MWFFLLVLTTFIWSGTGWYSSWSPSFILDFCHWCLSQNSPLTSVLHVAVISTVLCMYRSNPVKFSLIKEGTTSPELWECFSTIFGTSSIASIIGRLLEAFSFPSPQESSLSLIQNLHGKTYLVYNYTLNNSAVAHGSQDLKCAVVQRVSLLIPCNLRLQQL